MSIHDPVLVQLFPKCSNSHSRITSSHSNDYNCISWAAKDDHFWWDPNIDYGYYWPRHAIREGSLKGWQSAFSSIGYQVCATGDFDFEYEKISIYAKEGEPTHAARQLPNGKWTSKCGRLQDIEHLLEDLEGLEYGMVTVFMRRKLPSG